MCRREMPGEPGKECGCESETVGKEDTLMELRRYKRKLESELIAIDIKLKSADKAGEGGE